MCTGRRESWIQHTANLLKKLTIWSLEIGAEALGTSLTMLGVGYVEFRGMGSTHLGRDLVDSAKVSVGRFFYFALTGYLATTLILRVSVRGSRQRWDPSGCAVLYLIHSTIFFLGAGNSIFRGWDWAIQVPGSCLTLLCAWSGNRLVRTGPKWGIRSQLNWLLGMLLAEIQFDQIAWYPRLPKTLTLRAL